MSALTVGDVLTSLSILIAGFAVGQSRMREIRESQLQVLLGLGGEYRDAWRHRWRVLPAALSAAQGDLNRLSAADFETLVDALNWIDWFGVACRTGIVRRQRFVFDTVGPSMLDLIASAEAKLADDEHSHGQTYWSGVRYVEARLKALGITTASASWTAAQNASRRDAAD